MRQVPKIENPIGVVGDGRVARHVLEYFRLKQIPCKNWSRRNAAIDKVRVSDLLAECKTILILIKDSEIEPFILHEAWLKNRRLVHFSGDKVTDLAIGLHPLMTFGDNLYDLEVYQKIPFIGEKGSETFREIFPFLENPSFEISKNDKALYHAYCVMSGNFTIILWQKFFKELSKQFSLDSKVAIPYLQQTMNNLIRDPLETLTGPFARKDFSTISNNLEALQGDQFQDVYRARGRNAFRLRKSRSGNAPALDLPVEHLRPCSRDNTGLNGREEVEEIWNEEIRKIRK